MPQHNPNRPRGPGVTRTHGSPRAQSGTGHGPGTPGVPHRPKLNRRDVFHLILAAYKTSFPYFLLFVLVMLIVTWLLTEFAFAP